LPLRIIQAEFLPLFSKKVTRSGGDELAGREKIQGWPVLKRQTIGTRNSLPRISFAGEDILEEENVFL
jgi:hypothetical protein